MIRDVTGIGKIRMLYLQLLYRCNFSCLHCFHGERLKRADSFSGEEAVGLIQLMHEEYGTEAVTLLGGEPFLYAELPQVVRRTSLELGMRVEICTNGYRVERRLTEIAPYIDLLRVSLEGVAGTNDAIRRQGSYHAALSTLNLARELGVATAATMTVTSRNIDEVLPLARVMQRFGARHLKLHCLRPIGNAARHSDLLVDDPAAYARLRTELRTAALSMDVILDEDLSEVGAPENCAPTSSPPAIERIEADPRGALTMSCKAVGRDAQAFWYDKATGLILHEPTTTDELTLAIPDVRYARV